MTTLNLDEIGHSAVREAFMAALTFCSENLTKAEVNRACEALDIEDLDEDRPGHLEMLGESALFSLPHTGRKRAVDRLAIKLATNRDPLVALIGKRLPSATFSIFTLEGVDQGGCVVARDTLDPGPPIRIMDWTLAAKIEKHGKTVVAARLVDLGPWHLGFGIVTPLLKSQVVAIQLALATREDQRNARADLHELVYTAQIHGLDLTMMAVESLIGRLATAIDTGAIEADSFTAMVRALLPGSRKAGRGDKPS